MKYPIDWVEQAEEDLAAAYLAATADGAAAAVTAATAELERLLSRDPHEAGESRDDGRRIVIVPPLVATYANDEIAGMVVVLGVRYRRPPLR